MATRKAPPSADVARRNITIAVPLDTMDKLHAIAEHEERGENRQAVRLLKLAVDQTYAKLAQLGE